LRTSDSHEKLKGGEGGKLIARKKKDMYDNTTKTDIVAI